MFQDVGTFAEGSGTVLRQTCVVNYVGFVLVGVFVTGRSSASFVLQDQACMDGDHAAAAAIACHVLVGIFQVPVECTWLQHFIVKHSAFI